MTVLFSRECRELQLHIKSTAPKLALLSNFADVVIENAWVKLYLEKIRVSFLLEVINGCRCKHNAKFATLYAKYLATKTNPIPAVLNPKNMCPGVGLYNDRMKMMLNEEVHFKNQIYEILQADQLFVFKSVSLGYQTFPSWGRWIYSVRHWNTSRSLDRGGLVRSRRGYFCRKRSQYKITESTPTQKTGKNRPSKGSCSSSKWFLIIYF